MNANNSKQKQLPLFFQIMLPILTKSDIDLSGDMNSIWDHMHFKHTFVCLLQQKCPKTLMTYNLPKTCSYTRLNISKECYSKEQASVIKLPYLLIYKTIFLFKWLKKLGCFFYEKLKPPIWSHFITSTHYCPDGSHHRAK